LMAWQVVHARATSSLLAPSGSAAACWPDRPEVSEALVPEALRSQH
jgi:hypothetical protein